MPADLPNLVLASSSPRRRALLQALDLEFVVRPAHLEEAAQSGESPAQHVLRLARDKVRATAADGELVLAADTIVALDGNLMGKPADPAAAKSMLHHLMGRKHEVLTGVALFDGKTRALATDVARSEVQIVELTSAEIDWYVGTGEPLDKAGSYAIQGLGALFVEAVYGSYTNVVGLPLSHTRALFRQLGYDLLAFRK
jgi:septum formation protein